MKINQRAELAVLISCSVSVLFFALRWIHYNDPDYWYLNWNLVLALVPVFFAWRLNAWLQHKPWLSLPAIGMTIIWLGFLPNSFYISSDLIHLYTTDSSNILYDVVMLLSFSINGYLLGFLSIFLVHRQLIRRIKASSAHALIGVVLLLCSFAIYLGRYLRWNTWDVLINPAGVLFDVSDRIINPSSHPQTFVTTLSFFVLLGSLYWVIWQMVGALLSQKQGSRKNG